jgi:hypothetical protein
MIPAFEDKEAQNSKLQVPKPPRKDNGYGERKSRNPIANLLSSFYEIPRLRCATLGMTARRFEALELEFWSFFGACCRDQRLA